MQEPWKRGILFMAAVMLAAGLAGCGTFSLTFSSRARDVSLYQKGQVVDIQGRVVVTRQEISLEDQRSPAVFRLVGLRQDERKALTRLAGEVTVIRLKVVSTQSAHAYNAQLVQPSARQKR